MGACIFLTNSYILELPARYKRTQQGKQQWTENNQQGGQMATSSNSRAQQEYEYHVQVFLLVNRLHFPYVIPGELINKSVLVLKDTILRRTRQFYVNALLQKLSLDFEEHFKIRLLSIADGSFDGI